MGGAASGLNIADASVVKKYNLGAAVCLHPAYVEPTFLPHMPTFLATGSADAIVPPASVKKMWNQATIGKKVPMVFAEIKGANHFECQSYEPAHGHPKHRWTPYVIDWMDCYIKGVSSACTAAVSVCKGLPMSPDGCLHRHT